MCATSAGCAAAPGVRVRDGDVGVDVTAGVVSAMALLSDMVTLHFIRF
jgi:hypothetical protein